MVESKSEKKDESLTAEKKIIDTSLVEEVKVDQAKTDAKAKEESEEATMKQEFDQFMTEMKKLSRENNKFTAEHQLDKLLNNIFVNPFDILEIGHEASEAEIKKKFRMLSILVHPDKCRHERAADAFHVLEQAYKTLMDADKRRMYQRVMREARERVEYARKKEDARRISGGLHKLPQETLVQEVTDMCNKLFEEIEERKQFLERQASASSRKRKFESEKRVATAEIIQEDIKAWEENREQRVNAWRSFSHSKVKLEKRKKIRFGVHAPPVFAEKRPRHAPAPEMLEGSKPMGMQDEYKKKWR